VQGIGSQIEILKGTLTDQQQGIAVGKAHPGAGLLPIAVRLLAEPEQLNWLPRHPAQPLIGAGVGVQGVEAVAPDAGGLRGESEFVLQQCQRLVPRIAQQEAALHRGGDDQLQLGVGTGGDEAAIRFDHHVAAIPGEPLLGHQGAGQWHACRRLDGVEMYAGESRHVRVLVLWRFL